MFKALLIEICSPDFYKEQTIRPTVSTLTFDPINLKKP